jgi:hypothetical protein|tara:strand:+ start:442 stop:831 length:390 start_codon:yes stop_codon:yes gene_type:complete
MSDDELSQPLTPDDLLGDPLDSGPMGPEEQRARDMATMAALMGLVLVAGGLMAILALVLNQLLVFAILAMIVLGGFYLGVHYFVWGRRLDRQIASESKAAPTLPESASQSPPPPVDPAVDARGESHPGG